MNAKTTVEVIRGAASILDQASRELQNQAASMEKDGDLSKASECVNIITNLIPNLRLDLLVARPLREYERDRMRIDRLVQRRAILQTRRAKP